LRDNRRRYRLVVITVAAVALAGACSSGNKKAKGGSASTGSTEAAPTTTTVPPVFPLTGLRADDAARAGRPALSIKIENDKTVRPQTGLDAADVVYEEVVEGGDTRFLAVFQSTDAATVGPVRSVRPSDPQIVAPIGGLFAYSGGTAKFVNLIHQAPVADVGQSAAEGAYRRAGNRGAPYNLFSSTPALYAKAPASAKAPPPLFNYLPAGAPFAGAGAAPITHLGVTPGRNERVDYDWDATGGVWKRSDGGVPHTVVGGGQLAPTNVIIQFTPYVISPGDFDQAHSPVSVAQLVGSGEAWIMVSGVLVKGHWSKANPYNGCRG